MDNNIALLIKRLIKEHNIDQESLDNSTISDIIKSLAEYIAKEYKETENHYFLEHSPIFQGDFIDNSQFKELNKKIDLDNVSTNYVDEPLNRDTYIEAILRNLENNELWNYSIDQLLREYKNYFQDGTEIDSTNVTIGDIKNADAGNQFSGSGDSNEWVKPLKNTDDKEYGKVRGADKIETVLNSQKNLQFTKALKKYIRLIMPQYTRRVEVEDLNRNFWVIGQTLTAISAFLFDKDSPIQRFMKYSLSELVQLWENVIYLWAAIELLNEKQGEAPTPEPEKIPYVYSQTICQVIDIPRANDKPLRDINEFVNNFDWNKTETKLNQFTKMYSGKHLAFLLRCRIGNYEKDYYHTEIYPYVAFYDANSKQWTRTQLWNRNAEYISYTYDYFPFGVTLRIDSDAKIDGKLYNSSYNVQYIGDRVYAVRESANLIRPNEYYFYHPLSEMPPYDTYKHPGSSTVMPAPSENNANAYRAIVRIKPTITTNYDTDDTYIKVKIKFEVEDVARKLHWLTRASSDDPRDDAQNDKYRDYEDINGTIYDPKYNIITSTGTDPDGFYEVNSTSDGGHIVIQMNWNNWGKSYNASSNPHGTLSGFSTNFRDSGYQGSLCDMITYRGVSKSNSSSNG